jgi:ribosome biogenesis GTPase / thiamine phosphate phosphatase
MREALAALGWNERWKALFEPYGLQELTPARVIRGDRGSALVAMPTGIVRATPSARLLKGARSAVDLPAVGDWVALMAPEMIDVPQIDVVLPRTSAITRGGPAEASDVQVLAANVDTVFVVDPIAEPPNLRRIERELALAWESGGVPVIVLTKADLSVDPAAARAAVESIALGVDVLVINALVDETVAPLPGYMSENRTAVLLGPSGAGKSTMVNALLGRQRQETRAVRVSDQRGRHTTAARELIALPAGGVLIDTPGLRALSLTGSEGASPSHSRRSRHYLARAVFGTAHTRANPVAPSALRSTPESFQQHASPATRSSCAKRKSPPPEQTCACARRKAAKRSRSAKRPRTTSEPTRADTPRATLAIRARRLAGAKHDEPEAAREVVWVLAAPSRLDSCSPLGPRCCFRLAGGRNRSRRNRAAGARVRSDRTDPLFLCDEHLQFQADFPALRGATRSRTTRVNYPDWRIREM